MTYWLPAPHDLPTGPMFPPKEVEAARVRVLKRRIRRRVMRMIEERLKRARPKA